MRGRGNPSNGLSARSTTAAVAKAKAAAPETERPNVALIRELREESAGHVRKIHEMREELAVALQMRDGALTRLRAVEWALVLAQRLCRDYQIRLRLGDDKLELT